MGLWRYTTGILNALLNRRGYPPKWLGDWYEEMGGGRASSGINVSADSALTFVAFYSAVDLISRTIAHLPFRLYYRTSKRETEHAEFHPVNRLLQRRPNPEQTAFVFRQTMQGWILCRGNAYAEIERRLDGRPKALWPMDPTTVKIRREDGGALVYIQRDPRGGPEVRIAADDILHLRTMGDGLTGKSPTSLFRETLGLAMGAEKAGAMLFGQGMRPSGTVESPKAFSDIAYKRLKEFIETHATGLQNWAKPWLLEEGATFKPWTISPDDAQFLETLTYGVRSVARMFHVPPHKLGDLADATFSNVEEQNTEWVTDCLAPWMVNWEQECDEKLLLPGEQPPVFWTKHSAQALMRGNAVARSQYYHARFQDGSITQNEVRALEEENGIGPAGDVTYVPLNMVPSEIAVKGPQPKPAAPAPAAPATAEPAQKNAFRALLMDAWGRVCRMEGNAIARQLGRAPAEKIVKSTFGDPHIIWSARTLLPSVRAVVAALRPDLDAESLVGRQVSEHAATVRAVLLSGEKDEWREWLNTGPERNADDLLLELAATEEQSHV